MTFKFNYNRRIATCLTWDQLDIGDYFYHRNTHNICIKTAPKAYFCFNDKSYHTRSKLLSGGKYPNFYLVNCQVIAEL